jgi:prepilin-type N-terminal cleavage/methylation domain-containing protein
MPPHSSSHRASGFSLIEVLIATSIIAIALTALAQLLTVATRANVAARATTGAAIAARQKMEELRSLAWGVDAFGFDVSDDGLRSSPEESLTTSEPGYCDFLDASGRALGTGRAPPAGTAIVRRWSIVSMPGRANRTLILQVVAFPWNGADRPPPEAVRLTAIRTRRSY